MSEEWDGKVVMSTPGGPIVEMSLGEVLARKDAEVARLREQMRQIRERLHLAAGHAAAAALLSEEAHRAALESTPSEDGLRAALEGKP